VAEKTQQTHFLSNEEKAKWGKDFVERKTAVARMRVEDAETVMMQELNDMTTAENVGATNEKPETTVQEMLNHVGDNLSDLGSSDGEQDGEDKEDDEEDTELGKLGDDDEPGWVRGTLSKTVQLRRDCFWQTKMRLVELPHPGWGDVSNHIRERDMTYGTGELKVLVVVKRQIDTTATTAFRTTAGEHMETLDIIQEQSEMPAVPS
jgi:Uri superfamily endonuclease